MGSFHKNYTRIALTPLICGLLLIAINYLAPYKGFYATPEKTFYIPIVVAAFMVLFYGIFLMSKVTPNTISRDKLLYYSDVISVAILVFAFYELVTNRFVVIEQLKSTIFPSLNHVMDTYVAGHYASVPMETPNSHALGRALSRLAELREQPPAARTAHELMRLLEVQNLIDLAEFLARAYREPALADENSWFLAARTDLGLQFTQQLR